MAKRNTHRSDNKAEKNKSIQGGATALDYESRSKALMFKVLIFCIAAGLAVLHRYHVAAMFENDRHFSHLSSLEREMTFRTEMGLYYSYYKTLINAATYSDGLHEIMRDNVTEYPSTINTLKRFNLYPEVALAYLYRTYTTFAKSQGWETVQCWRTERGKDMDAIVSCEGMGDPFYFYVNMIFAIAGTVAGVLFMYGYLLSDSVVGGVLATACFFFNHGEATRVQWTPPLRESVGYPVFLFQMLIVSYIIKYRRSGLIWGALVAITTILFMLPWQTNMPRPFGITRHIWQCVFLNGLLVLKFAQFALSTQVGSIFVLYVLDYIPGKTLKTVALGHMVGFWLSYAFLFGNEMLLTSLFLSSLLTIQLIQVMLFAVGTIFIKIAIGHGLGIKDDAHIFNLLKSKLSNYDDFHTKMYSCAAEFDFLGTEPFIKFSKTLLLPTSIMGIFLGGCIVLYNIIQCCAFGIMALLIMRLKLFFTPHLCLMTSLLANRKLLTSLIGKRISWFWQFAVCFGLLSGMSIKGWQNLNEQWSISGEYSDPHQEHMFGAILKATNSSDVFAGSMPLMANVKLSTERPIVNHPHYEDAALRERVMKVYSIYSRKPLEEVVHTLVDMGVQYYIFEPGMCSRRSHKPGCSFPEMYDLYDVANRGKEPLCERIVHGKQKLLKKVYENPRHIIFQLPQEVRTDTE